nr:MAG TPA: hypothetical protein [Caudoviricetes sp.]
MIFCVLFWIIMASLLVIKYVPFLYINGRH